MMITDEKLIIKGKRLDGRKAMDIREMEMKVGVIPNANGSAYVRFGKTTAYAAVYGPRELNPRHLQEPDRAIIRCYYNMAPFSVSERKRPAPGRRGIEISKVTKAAIEPALFLKEFPETTIDIFIDIIQADGSTRVAGINAASLALADAGIPMKDLIIALSGGKINDTLVIDLCGKEDNCSNADIPIAFLPNTKEITLLQMDGRVTPQEVKDTIKNVLNSGEQVYKKQKEALKNRYK